MTDRSNLYALETTLSAGPICAEFDLESMRVWLAEIRRLRLRHALPQLIVKLDRMSRVAMSAAERRGVLSEFKRPLLKAAAGLPKPFDAGRWQDPSDLKGLLLEQRLYCLMAKNLKQVLQDLDHSGHSLSAEAERHRRWALRNLFRFLGRQIEFSLFWRQPPMCYTWRELHDSYSYVVSRGIAANGRWYPRRNGEFDPEREYKRLLLLGLAGRLVANQPVSSIPYDEIAHWVADTELAPPDSYAGEVDLFIVETSKDAPPRQTLGVLSECFLGWILIPASGFLAYATAVEQEILTSGSRLAGRSASRMH